MFSEWNQIMITKIGLAIFVAPETGGHIHNNRPLHGLVLNGKNKRADYLFSDGTILKTYEYSLFYLPKDSCYQVLTYRDGEGCWAINFDCTQPLSTPPFTFRLQNPQPILQAFKKSVAAFRSSDDQSNLVIVKNLYDILLQLKKEYDKKYLPHDKMRLLQPALDQIHNNYTQNELSIDQLSALCGISVAYFRRLFTEKFGISPKEYLIRRRMDYAKKLLLSRQFSVSEIASLCGYAEPCHFSREFSKRIGIAPSRYSDF